MLLEIKFYFQMKSSCAHCPSYDLSYGKKNHLTLFFFLLIFTSINFLFVTNLIFSNNSEKNNKKLAGHYWVNTFILIIVELSPIFVLFHPVQFFLTSLPNFISQSDIL